MASWGPLDGVASRLEEMILAFCSVLVRSHLESWVWFWTPLCRHTDILERVQQRDTKIKRLVHDS